MPILAADAETVFALLREYRATVTQSFLWSDVLTMSGGHCGEVWEGEDWQRMTIRGKSIRVVGLIDGTGPVIRWADNDADLLRRGRYLFHDDFLYTGDDITRVRSGYVEVGLPDAPDSLLVTR